MSNDQEKDKVRPPRYVGAGLILGAGLGAATGNLAVGIAVGLAIGAALESYHKEKRENDSGDDEDSD